VAVLDRLELPIVQAPMAGGPNTPRKDGDADVISLWAGQAHSLAEEVSAAELTRRLAADARVALETAARRLGSA
jgi:nitronate monooxygenase